MAEFVTGSVQVRVPATSANLGPGFDSLGLALGLHDVLTGAVLTSGPAEIAVEGEGADTVACDETHLVHRSMVRAFELMEVPVPPVRLACSNAIPHGRGLGSSSAAIVGGLCLARALVVDGSARMDDEAMFRAAAEIEGHPDNVAPAVFGGFTIAFEDTSGYRAAVLEVSSPVSFVVFVPQEPLETKVARGLLPATVSHADAAHNAGRAALLVAALTGRPDMLLAATDDRLHQPYRASAMPVSLALVERLRSTGLPAVVSGAGPTVLAMVAAREVASALAEAPDGWWAETLDVDTVGVRVL